MFLPNRGLLLRVKEERKQGNTESVRRTVAQAVGDEVATFQEFLNNAEIKRKQLASHGLAWPRAGQGPGQDKGQPGPGQDPARGQAKDQAKGQTKGQPGAKTRTIHGCGPCPHG